ncbi:CDGSH iron-sulfur domain-containing protein [Sulfurimonas sp. HSL-3221]|uniref:CDGSH iron-sulfur domain-containing protein n=1 Tax=Sulfurimonadaceae TaxID=2771471 RepID=UPI001E631549|nr:CDGSH iron-sulfur domain-containing protein [Sulfurimonas sp. HSL-3221]UFS63593.1 CDGSH iron-sulfur domain-containing protein [Sulfurimonas sp. HSL-3221]
MTETAQSITIVKNGPLIVRGSIPLSVQTIGVNDEGEAVKWIEGKQYPLQAVYSLCRCGQSKKHPFCDGSHAKCGFDGTETAERLPIVELSKTYDGPDIYLTDAKCYCALARFCDPHGGVWNMVKLSDDPEIRPVLLQEVWDCPAGRLVAWDKKTGEAIEPKFEHSIVLIEDPQKHCSGPIWVRGGIPVISADGTPYEIRNRVTLCRCGASHNKPFCDARHLLTHFKATEDK